MSDTGFGGAGVWKLTRILPSLAECLLELLLTPSGLQDAHWKMVKKGMHPCRSVTYYCSSMYSVKITPVSQDSVMSSVPQVTG